MFAIYSQQKSACYEVKLSETSYKVGLSYNQDHQMMIHGSCGHPNPMRSKFMFMGHVGTML
jgi:hypothetical protein